MKKAINKYVAFHKHDPRKISEFPPSFSIPDHGVLVGKASYVLYRSDKHDPTTLVKPKRPINYIHEHDSGVRVVRFDRSARGTEKRIPSFICNAGQLVLLGQCLGFGYLDEDREEIAAETRTPYPELYTIPSGKALLVVQGKRSVQAIIWGGRLGVEARGIVH